MKFYKLLIILAICMPMWGHAFTQTQAPVKKQFLIQREIKASDQVTLTNKYGKIEIKLWDQQEMKAEILVTATGSNTAEMQKIVDNVSIMQLNKESSYSLQTQFKKELKMKGRSSVQINYVVHLPRRFKSLVLNNSFGDILAAKLPAEKTTINLMYGYLNLGEVSAAVTLNMSYVDNGVVQNAEQLAVNANYCSISFGQIKRITISSNNGKYQFKKVDQLVLKSNYDKYEIGEVLDLKFEGNYGNAKIDQLSGSAKFSGNYSDLSVRKFNGKQAKLALEGNYCKYIISVDKLEPIDVDVSLFYGSANYSDINLKVVEFIKERSHFKLKGSANQSSQSSSIKVSGTYSNLTLKAN